MKHARRYVCRRYNIEYLEIPKVACTSIKAAILKTDGQNVPGNLLRIHHNPWWTENDTDPHLTFTFVRHPLDRLVSCYWNKLATGQGEEIGVDLHKSTPFGEFVRFITVQREPDAHYAPQSRLIAGKRLEWLGHFETLTEDWAKLQRDFKDLDDLPHFNVSQRPLDWREMYDDETLAIATRYYWRDLALWPQYLGDACLHPRV